MREARRMSGVTDRIRAQGFLPLASDLPEGITLPRYRAGRRPPRTRRRLGRRARARWGR
jgi:hypothetical protein